VFIIVLQCSVNVHIKETKVRLILGINSQLQLRIRKMKQTPVYLNLLRTRCFRLDSNYIEENSTLYANNPLRLFLNTYSVYGQSLRRLSFSLGRYATVFQAEIYAILACIYEIQFQNRSKKYVSICSDSQAALKALRTVRTTSPLVYQCRR
jgi:hypothetical protein